jgi:hypothetical protein
MFAISQEAGETMMIPDVKAKYALPVEDWKINVLDPITQALREKVTCSII